MVVIKDIECVIYYYKVLIDFVVKLKLFYKVFIVFFGEKEMNGVIYIEVGLNGFVEMEIVEKFDVDENCILVVVNKYFIGFD